MRTLPPLSLDTCPEISDTCQKHVSSSPHSREPTMTRSDPSLATSGQIRQPLQLRVWHLALLVLYVALATLDVRDQTQHQPFLMALATVGFAGYALLGWLGWNRFRRFES